jgi:flagellar biosynthesis/type III secretory pathway protein FliH
MTTTFEDKTVKELLALLETAAPTVIAELRDRLKELEREIYSAGYSDGLNEGVERATVSGGQVAPSDFSVFRPLG